MDTLLQRLCHPYGVTQVCRESAQWPLPSPVVGTSPWMRIFPHSPRFRGNALSP